MKKSLAQYLEESYWYLLDRNKQPVPIPLSVFAAKGLYEVFRQQQRVAETTVGEIWVSTVFLGIDHNHSLSGPPVLFETMLFGDCNLVGRYCTWSEALVGHRLVVKCLQARQAKIDGMKPKAKHNILPPIFTDMLKDDPSQEMQ